MALMVYIKDIQPQSFLHLSTDGENFCLRDFSQQGSGSAIELARQSEGRGASSIRVSANQPGNYAIEVAGGGHGVGEYAFWHKETLRLNAKYVTPTPAPPAPIPPTRSWLVEHITKVFVGVITAVAIAAVLTWLGLKQ